MTTPMNETFIPNNLIKELTIMKQEATRIHTLLTEMFMYNEATKNEPLPDNLDEKFPNFNPVTDIVEDEVFLRTLASIVIDNRDDLAVIYNFISKADPDATLEMHVANMLKHLHEIDVFLRLANDPSYDVLEATEPFPMHDIMLYPPAFSYADETMPTHNDVLENAYCADREAFVELNRKALSAEMSCLINVLREYEQFASRIDDVVQGTPLDVAQLKEAFVPLQYSVRGINSVLGKPQYYIANRMQDYVASTLQSIMELEDATEIVTKATQLTRHFTNINALTIMQSCMVITNLSCAYSNQTNVVNYESTQHFCNAVASTVNMLRAYSVAALHDNFIYNLIYEVTYTICSIADIKTDAMDHVNFYHPETILEDMKEPIATNPFE